MVLMLVRFLFITVTVTVTLLLEISTGKKDTVSHCFLYTSSFYFILFCNKPNKSDTNWYFRFKDVNVW